MARLIAGIVLTLFACTAQSQKTEKLEFEVALVKPSPPPGPGVRMGFRGGPGTADPTRLTIDGFPMNLLIMPAYDLSPLPISGVDRAAERFTITPKAPGRPPQE